MQELTKSAKREAEKLPATQLLQTSENDLVEDLIARFSLQPVELQVDRIYQHDPREVRIPSYRGSSLPPDPHVTVPGVAVANVIPFGGNATLLKLTPSRFYSVPPRGRGHGQEIVREFTQSEPNAGAIENEYKVATRSDPAVRDVATAGRAEPPAEPELHVRNAIQDRKRRLAANAGLVTALNLPLKRGNLPETYRAPVRRPARRRSSFRPRPPPV